MKRTKSGLPAIVRVLQLQAATETRTMQFSTSSAASAWQALVWYIMSSSLGTCLSAAARLPWAMHPPVPWQLQLQAGNVEHTIHLNTPPAASAWQVHV